jgi:hypothetical protein
MLLNIHDDMTVGDLQDKFNECFQHLKIEFYHSRHKWQKASSASNKINADRKIAEIRKNHNNGVFEIKSWYKTGRVEQELRELFGLYAQIFFLKNNEWVQSVSTDDLTLGHLNEAENPVVKKEEGSR